MLTATLIFSLLFFGLIGFAASKPNRFVIERTVMIAAPPEWVFPLVNDLETGLKWSPFERLDPSMVKRFSGPKSGPGAAYDWEGNRKAGAGRIEIVEITQPSLVILQLTMDRPMKAINRVEYHLDRQGNATRFTWKMTGPQPFIAKLMSLIIETDKIVGPMFEEGLANLKALAEHRV